jgi:hypothetical protein
VLLAVGALALLLAGTHGPPRAAAETSPPALHPYTDVAVPAEHVVLLGASTSEPGAPRGATWGLGETGSGEERAPELVRYTPPSGEEGGWEPGPALPAGFVPDHPEEKPSPFEGDVTPEGYGVLAGTTPQGETVLVRKPGGAFEAAPSLPTEAEGEGESGEGTAGEEVSLHAGQRLFASKRAPMIAPLQEAEGVAGALVVPVWTGKGVDEAVLHWDGRRWTREPIEIPTESKSEFNVLAIAATSPENAWLLARLSGGSVALFRRVKAEEGEAWSWEKVEVGVGEQTQLPLGVPVSGGEKPFGVLVAEASEDSKIAVESQLLTVTSEGVWVDGVRTHEEEDSQPYTTLYVRTPPGGAAVVAGSWCNAPSGAPACGGTLPAQPPQQYGRSIAWANSSTSYGERVITGLGEGVMLRLNGDEFERVLSIGAEENAEGPGQLYGAAFSSANEGWLGYKVPVHMTSASEPDRLGYWPLATRHPLLAVAPQPGAPVAALSSEAVAVGESGGVARYKPGTGWLPESLFGPGERIETPTLRAVAWPTPNRVYAVGAHGEMWLWRGETGLWERDPATPINFRANLYGIAFDPTEPARGYAVGAQEVGAGGVLLRYGKTWTEETTLPAEVQGAQFTGIAFAGSEALVAFNLDDGTAVSGGLLVNDGGGWSVDSEEQQVTGSAEVEAVAGLPDGGAAVLAIKEGIARLYERESAGAPWRQEATPLLSGSAGSLALYRQNGALRALDSAAGAAALTRGIELEPSPGSPPYLEHEGILGAGAAAGAGALLRQTATGWRDERHDVIPVGRGQDYDEYDEPDDADPAVATLVSPSGTEAWDVGGISNEDEYLQTADVARYPAEQRPPNEGTSQIPVVSEEAGRVTTLAFGGGANCMAPCAERVNTGIGPQVWLQAAVSLAHGTGAAAFFYTGPLVHYSPYEGEHPPLPPYGEEYARDASLLGGALPWPAYAVGSEGELAGEAARVSAFGGLAAPLGATPPDGGWVQAGSQPTAAEREHCSCADGYYAVSNEHVVVAVLDDGGEGASVEGAQREWLERELQEAGMHHKPVIAVGEADLGAQLAPGKHDAAAEALFAALAGRDPDGGDPGGYAASAYVYDAPEANVVKTISFGGASLPVLGSGTLGYELVSKEETSEFHGQKGILLAEVQWGRASAAESARDRVPVAARLIPVVGELGMESEGGTLLKRSEVTLFRGLARRPRAGCRGTSAQDLCEEGQYVQIPAVCIGQTCGEALLPEYEFRSSRPDIGGFVKLNTAASNPLATPSASVPPNDVLLNAKGEPVRDGREEDGEQVGATSGLFCAYNAGETQVTISAGGRSYTLPVHVQAGSVRQPCGTVPLRELPPVKTQPVAPPPQPAPAPGPAAAPAASPTPPPPLPPPPALPAGVPARVHAAVPPPFVPLAVEPTPLLAFVPPPLPTPARPTPPTGTSAVTSPVEMAEKEEEREEAPESVSNKAVAYEQSEHDPPGEYVLGLVLLAALAGASIRRGARGRREVRVAPATLNTRRERPRGAPRSRRERW